MKNEVRQLLLKYNLKIIFINTANSKRVNHTNIVLSQTLELKSSNKHVALQNSNAE